MQKLQDYLNNFSKPELIRLVVANIVEGTPFPLPKDFFVGDSKKGPGRSAPETKREFWLRVRRAIANHFPNEVGYKTIAEEVGATPPAITYLSRNVGFLNYLPPAQRQWFSNLGKRRQHLKTWVRVLLDYHNMFLLVEHKQHLPLYAWHALAWGREVDLSQVAAMNAREVRRATDLAARIEALFPENLEPYFGPTEEACPVIDFILSSRDREDVTAKELWQVLKEAHFAVTVVGQDKSFEGMTYNEAVALMEAPENREYFVVLEELPL